MSRGCFGGDGQSGIQCEFGEVSCCELGKESLCSGVQNLIMVSGAEVIDDFVGTIGQEVEECVILVFFCFVYDNYPCIGHTYAQVFG